MRYYRQKVKTLYVNKMFSDYQPCELIARNFINVCLRERFKPYKLIIDIIIGRGRVYSLLYSEAKDSVHPL